MSGSGVDGGVLLVLVLLEALPVGVLTVELLAVVAQEEQCETCEQYVEEGSPFRHLIENVLVGHPHVQDLRGQLEGYAQHL